MSYSPQAIRELFSHVRELPSDKRLAWLEENCADLQARQEIQELLKFDRDDRFLETPLVRAVDADLTAIHPATGRAVDVNTLLGERYRLLQKIGEGGFGVVYMAEQLQPVRRRVAVKLLRACMESPSVVARFESERQALAVMDHPHIARVFDGGMASDGTPYFVMELVSGVPITDYCQSQQLAHTERIRLVISVCNAVQHAHQKGIIHRDLKPSNILVSLLDGTPVPKVIDFGIAKAIHGPLTDNAHVTAFQQMIGTPEYMSPEQAETSLLDVDTRSDVYSLGVVLYELLTGTTPLDGRVLRKLGLAEMQRTIRETEPPKPSDRLSTSRDPAATTATRRFANQASAIKMIRGDLDWIVMKALEKDRQRRYNSAQALADDLQRWLSQEPIEARPPSVLYRSTKFIRKHRTRVLMVLVAMVGLLASAIGFGYGWSERNASLQRQASAAERAEQLQQLANLEADRNTSLRYGNAMIAAGESLRSGRRQTSLDLLAECPKDKRGIEWQWLDYMASDKTQILQSGTKDTVQHALAYDGSKHRLFSAGSDGMVRLWNTDTYQELQSWRAANEPITVLHCAPSGRQLLIGTQSGIISVLDIASGKAVSTSSQRITASVAVMVDSTIADGETHSASSATKNQYAVGTHDGAVYLWSDSLEAQPLRLENHERPIRGAVQSLQFSQDGRQLVVAGKAGLVLFDTASGQSLQTYGQSWLTYGAMFAENLKRIVFYGPPIITVDAQAFDQPKPYEVPSTGIVKAAYASSDKSVIFATEDQCLRRLNLDTGIQETLGYCHAGAIVQLAAADDGHSVAIIDQLGTLRVLNRNSYICPVSYTAFECEVAGLASHASNAVYALSTRGELVVWNAQTNQEFVRQSIHERQGFSLALDGTASRLITNGLDQRMRIWSTDSLRELAGYDLALESRFIACHPDGIHLAGPMPKDLASVAAEGLSETSAQSTRLALWNLETGRVERCFGPMTNWAMQLNFSRRGTLLAAATISDGALIWQRNTAEPIRLVAPNETQVDQVAFSHDDRFLLAAYRNGQVLVWDISEQRVIGKMVCHGDQLSSLLMTEDGTRVLTSSSSDSIIRVWDWQSGQKVAQLDSGLPGISDLKFTDKQKSLLIGGKNGRLVYLRLGL